MIDKQNAALANKMAVLEQTDANETNIRIKLGYTIN